MMKINKIITVEYIAEVEPGDIIRNLLIEAHLSFKDDEEQKTLSKIFRYFCGSYSWNEKHMILAVNKFIFNRKIVWLKSPLNYLLKPKNIKLTNIDFGDRSFDKDSFALQKKPHRLINYSDSLVSKKEFLNLLNRAIIFSGPRYNAWYVNALMELEKRLEYEMEDNEED